MATARDIIVRALRLNQILGADEPGDSADLSDSLFALNAMLDSWPLSRLMVLAGATIPFNLTAGYTYAIGPGATLDTPRIAALNEGSFIRYQGIDRLLVQIDQAEYNAITNKFVPGIPQYVYFDPNNDAGTLTFYPGPQAAMQLFLAANLPFTQFADLDTVYTLAPGYVRALQYNLAVEVAPEYGKEATPTAQRIAQASVRQLKKSNASVPLAMLPAGIPRNGWLSYANFIAGNF